MIGSRLGPFEITAILGQGGMGVVYRARDTQLGRDVALKVLPEGVTADRERVARLEREAKLLAQLNHPNIAQVYGFVADGETRAIVMELVEGPTLAERVSAARLPPAEALSIARQVAEALEEAHERGIVHRDLKPQNIKITTGTRIKVLDFGLAKALPSGAGGSDRSVAGDDPTVSFTGTRDGLILGTAAYMAPEQARGADIDKRVDIWSFGVVLYEMLTGSRLFAADSVVDILGAVVQRPIDFDRLPDSAPARVRDLVRRCLERDSRRRLRDIGEARIALDESLSRDPLVGRPSVRARERAAMPCVAVLPFVNLSARAEDEYIGDGLTEDVIAHLAKVRSLRVISRTSVLTFKRREQSLRDIGMALGATSLLEGSVRRAGGRVRIVAQLVDRDTDEHVWAETYDRDLTDIFAIQTDVALKIASALRTELTPDEVRRMSRSPTHDLGAYELYLQGRQYFVQFTADGLRRSINLLQQAVARDPGFALAYSSLAQAYAHLVFEGIVGSAPEQAFASAKDASARALALDPTLGAGHGAAGFLRFACDFDWAGAERQLRRGLELSPGSADLHASLGQLCMAVGRYDEALEAMTRAREIDPIAHRSDVAIALLRAGRFQEALDAATRLTEAEPGFARGHSMAGWARIFLGDGARGVAELERAAELSPGASQFLAQLGQAYAMTGAIAKAREILQRLERLSADQYVAPYHVAFVYTGLGEQDKAIDCLEQAFEQRAGGMFGIKGSFLFKPLREHPRFVALLGKMNLNQQ